MPAHRSGAVGAGQPACANIPGLSLKSKRWIEVDGQFAIGEGGGRLLIAIVESGSLTGAARQVGWSYRQAWGYIRRAESVLGVPLLSTRAGKGASRGAQLTTQAAEVVKIVLGHNFEDPNDQPRTR